MLALVSVACGSGDDDDSSNSGVPASSEVSDIPTLPQPTTATSVAAEGGPAVDAAAVAEAEAVLVGIAERNENVSDSYDIGGGDHCPLIADFDGMWLAEAGGTLGCTTTDDTMTVGAVLTSTFADLLAEDDKFEQVGADGPVNSWCREQACIVSWTSGTIDVFVFQYEAGDPSSAERYLLDHLDEIIEGVATFDVELIPAS